MEANLGAKEERKSPNNRVSPRLKTTLLCMLPCGVTQRIHTVGIRGSGHKPTGGSPDPGLEVQPFTSPREPAIEQTGSDAAL
jgi:hypothetical protein